MNIIIVGCGKIGTTLAEQLSQEEFDITMIDIDRHKLQNVTDTYDVMGLIGNGTSFQLLEEAGLEQADMLIAVTGSDEVNLLCCVMARKVGQNIVTIARVRDFTYYQERGYLQQSLGINMILNPELNTATEIARLLRTPKAIEISTIAQGQAELLTFTIEGNSPLAELPVYRMNQKLGTDVLVCAVHRDGMAMIPRGDFVFRRGDTLSIVGAPRNTAYFFRKIGMSSGQVRDVMIIGGSRIAYYLAYQLESMKHYSVKIVEVDQSRCDTLSELLSNTMVIHGSSLKREVLMEEGLTSTEAVVPLTNIDEENLMLGMLTSICNPKAKLVTKVSHLPYKEVTQRMNVGSLVCPKELAARNITQFVYATRNSMETSVEASYPILDGQLSALEFHLKKDSAQLNVPLKELPLRKDLLIASVIREGRVFNPGGNDVLKCNDRVIVVTGYQDIREFGDILERGGNRR